MKTIRPRQPKVVRATMYVLVNKFGLVRSVADSMLAAADARREYGKPTDSIYLCEGQVIVLGRRMS